MGENGPKKDDSNPTLSMLGNWCQDLLISTVAHLTPEDAKQSIEADFGHFETSLYEDHDMKVSAEKREALKATWNGTANDMWRMVIVSRLFDHEGHAPMLPLFHNKTWATKALKSLQDVAEQSINDSENELALVLAQSILSSVKDNVCEDDLESVSDAQSITDEDSDDAEDKEDSDDSDDGGEDEDGGEEKESESGSDDSDSDKSKKSQCSGSSDSSDAEESGDEAEDVAPPSPKQKRQKYKEHYDD